MPILTNSRQADAAPSGAAKKPAAFRGRVPNKANINLALVGIKRTRWWLFALVLVLILAAAAAIGKFLVYDRLEAVSAAQAEVAQVRKQIDEYNAKIEAYGELNELFAHYTFSGMTAEEQNRVDRVAAMEMIQRVVMPRTDVSQWQISGNRLTMTVEGDTLQQINLTAQKLLEEEMVSYCEVNTATTDARTRLLENSTERVAATIVVYLVKPEEVAK